MIKIIKEGKTDFRMTCDKCGCVFEYNVEDINDSYIKCPTCHKQHYGFEPDFLGDSKFSEAECEKHSEDLPSIGYPMEQYANGGTSTDCRDCPTYQQICSPRSYYVGDVSCQWCNKNPYRLTCNYLTSTNVTPDLPSVEQATAQITCKAEGIEYTTNLDSYPSYYTELPIYTTYTVNLESCRYDCACDITPESACDRSCFAEEATAQKEDSPCKCDYFVNVKGKVSKTKKKAKKA